MELELCYLHVWSCLSHVLIIRILQQTSSWADPTSKVLPFRFWLFGWDSFSFRRSYIFTFPGFGCFCLCFGLQPYRFLFLHQRTFVMNFLTFFLDWFEHILNPLLICRQMFFFSSNWYKFQLFFISFFFVIVILKCLVMINNFKFVYFNLSRAYLSNVIVYLHGKTNSDYNSYIFHSGKANYFLSTYLKA